MAYRSSRRQLSELFVTSFLFTLFSILGGSSTPDLPSTSPQASTSLICSDFDPSDCYPSLFQPTIYFQPIRVGQSLPPGLHVRLNIATGEKEARLNVPEGDGGDESAVVVIDNSAKQEPGVRTDIIEVPMPNDPVQMSLNDPSRQAYRKVSSNSQKSRKINHSSPKVDSSKSSQYDLAVSSLLEIRSSFGDTAVSEASDALSTLTDLAHSLDWGVTIARDEDLCLVLCEILSPSTDDRLSMARRKLRPDVFLLLGTAIQNNAAANAELQSFADDQAIGLLQRTSLLLVEKQHGHTSVEQSSDGNLISRAIFFIHQFCADSSSLDGFVKHFETFEFPSYIDKVYSSGLVLLQSIFAPSPADGLHDFSLAQRIAHSKIQTRIVHFLDDYAVKIVDLLAEDLRRGRKGDFIYPWCDILSLAIEARSQELRKGRRKKARSLNPDDDAAYISFVTARESVSEALKAEGFDKGHSCFKAPFLKQKSEVAEEL